MRKAAVVLGLVALACRSPTAPAVLGTWGGRQASLVLADSGGAVSYRCGSSTIDSAWTLSPAGQFSATGRYYFGGGPVPPGGGTPHPARYSGQILGSTLTLTVTLTDLGSTLGPFILVRDGPPVIQLCV